MDESGWLIERSVGGVAHYWSMESGDRFTSDNQKAVRFCRKVDAEAVIAKLALVTAYAVEHSWSN